MGVTRLVLATNDLSSDLPRRAGIADIMISLRPRFVWGQLPPEADVATLLELTNDRL